VPGARQAATADPDQESDEVLVRPTKPSVLAAVLTTKADRLKTNHDRHTSNFNQMLRHGLFPER
jgi:hypothetical protein